MPSKLETFLVEFDNPSAIYFAGQTVNGRVLVVLTQPMKMRGIRLHFTGRAYTHWTETRTYYVTVNGKSESRTETVTYSDYEMYIDAGVTLWGKLPGSTGDNPFMQPGSYQMPFTFTIPPNCPSSFEGTWGHIRYVCKATIDKPWKFDHTTKRAMTVVSLVDLNFFPNAQMPLTDEQMKTLGMWCCKSGKINCSIRIPRGGFVPGEVMPIEMQVINNSSSKVDEVKVCVEEYVEYYAQGHRKNSVRTVAQMKKGTIQAGETQMWKNEGMRLPPMAPTLMNCRIMKINYFLHFNVDPSGLHTDLSFKIPIIIGNVPLRMIMQEMTQNYQREISSHPAAVHPSAPPLPLSGEAAYPDLPPPSYQQAIYGQTSIKEEGDNEYTMGQMAFTPSYPYYDWSQTSFAPPIVQ